jgi:hypothetical protein
MEENILVDFLVGGSMVCMYTECELDSSGSVPNSAYLYIYLFIRIGDFSKARLCCAK